MQVEPQEKAKTPKGRAYKRLLYTRRFVNVTMTGGKRKVRFQLSIIVSGDGKMGVAGSVLSDSCNTLVLRTAAMVSLPLYHFTPQLRILLRQQHLLSIAFSASANLY